MKSMMSRAATLERKLTESLHAQSVYVIDESHLHAGHSGAPDGGESHFRITIVSKLFSDIDKVSRHRMVYTILSNELSEEVHAISLKLLTPDEASKGKP